MLCGFLSICGFIIKTNRRKDLICLRSEYTVQIGSCVMLHVIFPNARRKCISASLGMSGKTLLSTTGLDAITYGLHCMKVLLMFIPPEAQIWLTKDSAARYTHIRPPTQSRCIFNIATSNVVCSYRQALLNGEAFYCLKITPHLL
jgi:hypothetical protein